MDARKPSEPAPAPVSTKNRTTVAFERRRDQGHGLLRASTQRTL